jgi:hypothetical protein
MTDVVALRYRSQGLPVAFPGQGLFALMFG